MVMTSTKNLWEEYSRTKSPIVKQQLALEYAGVVKYVVSKFRTFSKQSVSVIEENDLKQLGMIGLLDSIDRFDPARGVKFETYAITRIRGTVQDELRKLDWVPRSMREKVRVVDRMTQKIECNDTLSGSAKTIAAELSMSVDEYLDVLHESQIARPDTCTRCETGGESLQNLADDKMDIADKLAENEMKRMVADMVEDLPSQDRFVIALYYYEELTFKEIASVLKLSESRVFQKHAAILERIREHATQLAC
jgi:RNA polymerase sigma factor for flagellar operon FliA